MKTSLIFFIPALLLISCSSNIIEDVDVIRNGDELIIENNSSEAIYYFAIEASQTPLIQTGDPCSSFKPNLDPGTFERLKINSIYSVTANSEMVNISWTNCQGSSGSQNISIH